MSHHETSDINNAIDYYNQREFIDTTLDHYATQKADLEAQLASTQDPHERQILDDQLKNLDQTWNELGGHVLDAAQRVVDDLDDDYDNDEEDYVAFNPSVHKDAYKALRDAEDAFYANIIAKLQEQEQDQTQVDDSPDDVSAEEATDTLVLDTRAPLEPANINAVDQTTGNTEAEATHEGEESPQELAIRLLDEFTLALEESNPRSSGPKPIGRAAVARSSQRTKETAKNAKKKSIKGNQEMEHTPLLEPSRIGKILSLFYTRELATKATVQKSGKRAMKKLAKAKK